MKKILSILLVIILSLSLVSCSGNGEPNGGADAENNVLRIHSDYFDAEVIEEIGSGAYIVRDKNTDVLYLVVGGYSASVMTPIYNSDGTVKLYD